VHAVALERARPGDVVRLVEARLQLDQHRHLLARLRRVGQRAHDRRVAARPVQRGLDRQHLRVLGRLLEEPLDRGRERVERVVDQQVALADQVEHRPRRARRHRRRAVRVVGSARARSRSGPGTAGTSGGSLSSAGRARERHQVAQLEQPPALVHVLLAERAHALRLGVVELLEQQRAQRLGHPGLHLSRTTSPKRRRNTCCSIWSSRSSTWSICRGRGPSSA
jgi:hypothetical protein